MLGLKKDTVSLCLVEEGYWKSIFENEKEKLVTIFQGMDLEIEHIGSTALPGIMAKPILDIAIGVRDKKDFDMVKTILGKNCYIFRPDRGNDGRMLFIKVEQEKRTHHLHVEEYGQESWNNHIHFRDCLLVFPDLRTEYRNLKTMLAEKYPDNRERYTNEKAEFIQDILSLYRSGKLNTK